MLRHSSASGTWGVGLGSAPFLNGVNMHIKKHWHIIFPCILALASILDLCFTLIIITADTRFYEGNPVFNYLLETYGYTATSIIKLGLTGLQCCLLWHVLKKKHKTLNYCLSWIILGVYTLLGLWWIYCWIIFFFY